MTVRFRRPRVAPRATLATVEIMLGVTLAHTWAGGSLPSLFGLIVVAGVVLGCSLLVLRGDVGRRAMTAVVLGAQLGLHTVFEFAGPAGHAAHGAAFAPLHLTVPMVSAHLVGTAVTVLVWSARRRAVEAIVTTADVVVPVPPGCGVRVAATYVAPALPLPRSLRSAPLRGPPVLLPVS